MGVAAWSNCTAWTVYKRKRSTYNHGLVQRKNISASGLESFWSQRRHVSLLEFKWPKSIPNLQLLLLKT